MSRRLTGWSAPVREPDPPLRVRLTVERGRPEWATSIVPEGIDLNTQIGRETYRAMLGSVVYAIASITDVLDIGHNPHPVTGEAPPDPPLRVSLTVTREGREWVTDIIPEGMDLETELGRQTYRAMLRAAAVKILATVAASG